MSTSLTSHTAVKIITLAVAISLLLVLNFTNAAWSDPTANPTGGNVAVPINTSTSAQDKAGSLSLGGSLLVSNNLAVQGAVTSNLIVDGELEANSNFRIKNADPTLKFDNDSSPHDNNNRDFWIRALENRLSFIQDGGSALNGSLDSFDYVAFTIQGAGTGDPFAGITTIKGHLRAPEYCDENGQNCFTASTVVGDNSTEVVTENIDNSSIISGWPTIINCGAPQFDGRIWRLVRPGGYMYIEGSQTTTRTAYMKFDINGNHINTNYAGINNEAGAGCDGRDIEGICGGGRCVGYDGTDPTYGES